MVLIKMISWIYSWIFFLIFYLPLIFLLWDKYSLSELLIFYYRICDYIYISIKELNKNFIIFIAIIIALDTIVRLIVKSSYNYIENFFFYFCEGITNSLNFFYKKSLDFTNKHVTNQTITKYKSILFFKVNLILNQVVHFFKNLYYKIHQLLKI